MNRKPAGILTGRQRKWCELVNTGMTGTDAMRKIDPEMKAHKHQARKFRAMPHVAAYLDQLAARSAELAGLTALKVLNDLETVKQRCMQATEVLDKEGKPIGTFEFEAHAALKAIELQGKHLKLFSDKVEHSGPGGGPITTIQRIERVIVKPQDTNG